MLRSINGENDQMSSRPLANSRSTPAISPASSSNGTVSNSPCTAAGRASRTPPTTPASGPAITPNSMAASKATSAARKFGVVVRITTPSAKGTPIKITSCSLSGSLRCSLNRRRLKVRERTSTAATAATTPSFTRRLIAITLSMAFPSHKAQAGCALGSLGGGQQPAITELSLAVLLCTVARHDRTASEGYMIVLARLLRTSRDISVFAEAGVRQLAALGQKALRSSVWLNDASEGALCRRERADPRWRLFRCSASSDDVNVLQSRAGVEQHHGVAVGQEAGAEQLAIRRQRRCPFRRGEDTFVARPVLHGLYDLGIADSNCGSAALAQDVEDDVIAVCLGHAQAGGDSGRVRPGLGNALPFLPGPGNWRAAGGLHGDHARARGADPAQLLHFVKRLPHPDQSHAAAGGVDNCVGQGPAELFGDLISHRLLAFHAKRLLERGNIEPAFGLLALGDHARAIADQPVHQR